ncbi:MAG: TonB-dependent receptor [Pseudomonadota bacterium]
MHRNSQNDSARNCGRKYLRAALLAGVALPLSLTATAQDDAAADAEEEARQDVVVVTGIRSSLASALEEKRAAANLKEVIQAEDIGKLPDQNLAEVLENITGVQITRTAGVGTGVQIRGTNSNRTEINGVSTVGSGSGRGGISFEDVSASMIAAVEVTKAPEAKTIEGSVGGTINLRTIRPLDLPGRLASIRVQGEDSSLTTDGITPRLSGTYGNNWSTANGDFGAVISASYSEQDVTAFRPRADRDNLIASDSGAASAQSFDFLPIQFLNQDYDNFEFETLNLAGSLEWAPNDRVTFFLDGVYNDQERRQESSRVQASGVSSLNNISVPDSFELVNFGTLNGENGPQTLGSIEAALTGVIGVDLADDDDDPNLRFSSDTNSRLTVSEIYRLGADWNHGNWSGRVELSTSTSDSTTPSFNTTLNFINPNAPLDAGGGNDNAVPFIYDLSDGLTFAVAQNVPFGPSTAELLDPANVVLRDVNIGEDTADNSEDAFRADFNYDLADNAFVGEFLTSVDFGYRYNKTASTRDQIRSNVGLRSLSDSPSGDLFADLLVAGPDNFGDADGRTLFVSDFLLIDPELVASDPDGVLATLNAAIAAHGGSQSIDSPTSSQSAFFDIEEETHAFYAQANFEHGMFRGNAGLRYLETDISSTGNSILNGVASPVTTDGSYDFLLPRFNLVVSPHEDVNIRLGWGTDIRRPDFDDLSTSRTFSTSPNPPVQIGNPGLEPEQVDSFDISAEWYFAPSAVVSIGYFNKKRTDLHVTQQDDPFEDPGTGFRDLTDPCEQGGIFNPIADVNVFGPDGGVGVCVPVSTTVNDPGETTQEGIEVAFQYDLSDWEDQIGWASGFGVVANYTHQEFSGGDTVNNATSRASAVFAALGNTDVTFQQPLIDLSENAYNVTLYYEKFGLSARARYTWRDAYRSTDFGSTSSFPWGFPVVQDARGQLNASISYDVNEHLNIGIEAVNLTESEVKQFCVNEDALLCFQGLTDRRITFGGSYTF